MLIVSDTSPITNLIQIGKLELLKQLFREIIIPEKVFKELAIYERHESEILKCDWIRVKSVSDQTLVKELENKLDSGEAEAIALAKEIAAEYLIIDERKGRKIAEEHGLKIIGLLGILIQAKRNGFLNNLRPILDELTLKKGFRISKELRHRILSEVNE